MASRCRERKGCYRHSDMVKRREGGTDRGCNAKPSHGAEDIHVGYEKCDPDGADGYAVKGCQEPDWLESPRQINCSSLGSTSPVWHPFQRSVEVFVASPLNQTPCEAGGRNCKNLQFENCYSQLRQRLDPTCASKFCRSQFLEQIVVSECCKRINDRLSLPQRMSI